MLKRSAPRRSIKPLKRAAPARGSRGSTAAKKAHKKTKEKSVSAWKKKVDSVVSIHVRQSGADAAGIAECYTCGKLAHWKTLQCGHFVSRNNSATRYDPENLRIQCAGCNVWGRGRYDVYADKLMDELGVDRFRDLLKRGRSTHTFTVPELKALYEKFSTVTPTPD
jgi:5-methylcytosine-specific restriction endonuclease McrA